MANINNAKPAEKDKNTGKIKGKENLIKQIKMC